MLLKHPLWGVGPGLFGTEYANYQATGDSYARYAHNALFHYAAETGLAGLLALGFFLFRLVQFLLRGLAAWKTHPQRVIVVGLTAALAAAVTHALGDVDFHFTKNAAVVMLLLGMLAGLLRPRTAAPAATTVGPADISSKRVFPFGRWLTLGMGAVLLAVLWRGGRSLFVEAAVYWALGLLWMIWMIAISTPGKLEIKTIPLRWWLVFLWVWGIVSAALSQHPAAAIPGLTLGLAGLVVFSLAWEWAPKSFLLLWALAASSLGLGILALGAAWKNPGMRLGLLWPNPNLLAAYLAAGCVACLGLAWLAAGDRRRQGLLGGAALVIALGIFTTGSLGGWLNLLVGMGVLAVWLARGRSAAWLGMAAGIVAVGALAWLLPFSLGPRLDRPGAYVGAAYERVHIASAAMQMGGDYPLTGVGPGNFGNMFERYSFPNVRGLARFGKVAEFAHCEPLQVLAVLGIPGLALLLVILGLVALRLRWQSAPGRAPWEWRESAPRIAAAVVLGAAAQGLVDFTWHLPALWLWSMALLGIVFVKGGEPPAVSAGLPANKLRLPLSLILILVGVSALLGAMRPLLSAYYLAQGEAQNYKKNFKNAAWEYQRALMVHPFSAQAYDRLGQTQADFYAMTGAEHWFALAEWAYLKAQSLDGLDPYIHRHLGQLYSLKASHLYGNERQSCYLKALEQYREGSRQAPHQAFLLFEQGNVARDAGIWDLAEESWRQAVSLEPHYAAAWSNLGVIQELRGNTPAAEASYGRALDLKSLVPGVQDKYEIELFALNWAVVHYNLAQLLERQGRWGEARQQYAQVLRLEPGNMQARKRWRNLGKISP
jgi:tetratricopeptide (TPR) repeat protein/O-antigen ligase